MAGASSGSGGDFQSSDHETIVNFLYVFTKMKEIIALQVWVQRYGYVVTLMIFVQAIVYLNGHPRVAILTKTLVEGWDDIFHYFLLMSMMYCVIAFPALLINGGYLSYDSIRPFRGSFSAGSMGVVAAARQRFPQPL